jgi:(2R)-sulfolactate sulfo-lyase subunit beta
MANLAGRKILGYRRENGRVGVRNHVIILPVDDISNAACEAVANNVKGTMALPHAYGRLQFGEDLELHFRTIIGTGSNPNVAAVIVIGIEPGWTNRIVEGIAKTGKPVTGFSIEGNGDIKTVSMASYQAKEYVQWASELQRTECDLHELYISVKCGESDTTTGLSSCPAVGNVIDKHCANGGTASFGETSELTGAEHIVASKAADDEVRAKFFEFFNDYTKLVFDQKTNDLSESQPTKGNIAGGLTTIEEKALGNVEKLGKKTKFVGCLPPAVAPTKPGLGLWILPAPLQRL